MSGVVVSSVDRLVKVIQGPPGLREGVCRVSDLRSEPFVVLLGEPGMGKSTVLAQEAAHEGAPVLKVREFINGASAKPEETLFLDALDEYRIDGQPSDKAYSLASAMASVGAKRWRLSCRSEDWRKEADIGPIQGTTSGKPIVVAQLLPLDHKEAVAVLADIGEQDPEAFLDKAESLGAGGFTESPLSLQLLHKAVSAGGAWPSTRYELFSSAISALAYERNPEHKWAEGRASRDKIVEAAADTCLLLLASGAKAIWASNDEPPSGGDDRAFLPIHDLPHDRDVLRDMLDTSLFRGEGEAFEPMHRTVAEFLASRALADAVMGTEGRAKLPLSRAIALTTGDDGSPPTELRGLYAWLAAHLAKLGDEAGALRMITSNAVTVLTYGDAAAFSTDARRAILANLDREDPYFRSSDVGVLAVGGLSGEDLAAEFKGILTGSLEDAHRTLTVLEALTLGVPVASLRPLLREIAFDPEKPEWVRWRAADAWLNGVQDVVGSRRALFDDLAVQPVSTSREALRAHLAAALPASALGLEDIKAVIADFERCPDDNTVMRLYRLRLRLEAEPRPELFDGPMASWRPDQQKRTRTYEVDDLLDRVLAASIRKTPQLDGARLWRWSLVARDDDWSSLGSETAQAVREWLDQRPGRDVELFNAVLAEDDPAHGPWVVSTTYTAAAGRSPSAEIVRSLLNQSADVDAEAAERLLAIAVAIARRPESDGEVFWLVYDHLEQNGAQAALLEDLSVVPLDRWRTKKFEQANKRRGDDEKTKARNLAVLTPVIEDLRVGRYAKHLDWAARQYFQPATKDDWRPAGLDRVAYFTDLPTAEALASGWEHLAAVDFVDVDAAKLGAADAESTHYFVEAAAIAGLHRLLAEGRCPDPLSMPIAVAISVLRSGLLFEGPDRERLVQWAINRLNLDPAAGASEILSFWRAALDGGAADLGLIWTLAAKDAPNEALAIAIDALLNDRRAMPAGALRLALRVAASRLDHSRIEVLAANALADPSVVGPARSIWSFVAFALDPVGRRAQFLAEHGGEAALGLLDEELGDGLVETFGGAEGGTRAHREGTIVRLLGPHAPPDNRSLRGASRRASDTSDKVRRAIQALSEIAHRDAARVLSSLIEEPLLEEWRPSLRHAAAQQARLLRDQTFRHPKPASIKAALAGGPPVNASDLRAVVLEELHRLRAEMRTSDTTPWKRYWNVDSQGKATAPLIENECRDRLLERLRDRLRPYKIAAVLPEARRGEETRTDMLVLTHGGSNLPVEVKRHQHPDIWSAASTQLQGYAADEGAHGFGIYLVFWFGNEAAPTPARPDGRGGPTSAVELERMLTADLSPELRSRTDVVVFDVSNPEGNSQARPRRRRRKGQARSTTAEAPPREGDERSNEG